MWHNCRASVAFGSSTGKEQPDDRVWSMELYFVSSTMSSWNSQGDSVISLDSEIVGPAQHCRSHNTHPGYYRMRLGLYCGSGQFDRLKACCCDIA